NDKVDSNRLNKDGDSPLHIACLGMAGNHDLALQMVASKRFDLTLRSNGEIKQTPMDIAMRLEATRLIEALEGQRKESVIKEKSATFFPPDANWANGSALKEVTVERCSQEYLENIQVGELTLIEWAIVHFDQQLINALNKKGIYFKLSEEKKDQLTIELIRFGHKCLQYLGKNIIQIAEHQKILKEVEEFVAKPDLKKIGESEILELWRETAHSYLKQCEIISRHKKEGSHLYGNEVLAGNNLSSQHLLKSYLDMMPGLIRGHMDMMTTMSREELMDQLGIPQSHRRLLEPVRSLKELMQFAPVFKAMQ
ncbi:MAG: hypothetical protein K940chlam6_01384, partial [Chlamydiae bacterium]|nr:hypothetical protein [Chlamydiota bacterium]